MLQVRSVGITGSRSSQGVQHRQLLKVSDPRKSIPDVNSEGCIGQKLQAWLKFSNRCTGRQRDVTQSCPQSFSVEVKRNIHICSDVRLLHGCNCRDVQTFLSESHRELCTELMLVN